MEWYPPRYMVLLINNGTQSHRTNVVCGAWELLIFSTQALLWNCEKQAEKLKSCKMKEGWMKNDEGWWFQAV